MSIFSNEKITGKNSGTTLRQKKKEKTGKREKKDRREKKEKKEKIIWRKHKNIIKKYLISSFGHYSHTRTITFDM